MEAASTPGNEGQHLGLPVQQTEEGTEQAWPVEDSPSDIHLLPSCAPGDPLTRALRGPGCIWPVITSPVPGLSPLQISFGEWRMCGLICLLPHY